MVNKEIKTIKCYCPLCVYLEPENKPDHDTVIYKHADNRKKSRLEIAIEQSRGGEKPQLFIKNG